MDKQILRLAIPNIITNVTVPLLGMVDMFIVGHLSSELFIGAIAIAAMVFNFIYWNFSFLRMGTSGFTAQAYGADDKKETVNILMRSLGLAFCSAVVIIALQYFIVRVTFLVLDLDNITASYMSTYFYIYIWSAPAILGIYSMTGWFIGMQDAKSPMYISIAINIVNIALSLLFVFVFGMELKGVALGSLIAQYMGLVLCVIVWLLKYKDLRKYIEPGILKNIPGYIPFFKVNGNIFLRTACLIIVTTFFTSASAGMGPSILAANSLMMQLFMLFSYMMDGFAYAGEALTGRFVGAKDIRQLKYLIKRLFIWGTGLAGFFTIAYLLFSENILHLLTDKENILEVADSYRLWVLLIPLAGFAAFLWDGIFIGMTASRQMRNSMFMAMLSFFAVYYSLHPVIGNNALWLAFLTYLFIRGIVQAFMYKKIEAALA